MKEVILIKNGELALKGLNRRTFEDMLMANIRRRLASLGKFTCTPAQSTIIVEGPEDADLDEATERLLKVFGIAGLSRAAAVEKDMDVILNTCVEYTAPCSTPHRLSRSRQSARTRSFRSILPRYAERSAERYSRNSTI